MSTPAAEDPRSDAWRAYFYPETYDPETGEGTLRNLAGIQDPDLLHDYEYSMTAMRGAQLAARPTTLAHTYDLRHLATLHQHLFQDVYEWAGQLRDVPLVKVKPFAEPKSEALFSYMTEAAMLANWTGWSQMSFHDTAAGLAEIYMNVNEAHPFREGNGRAAKAFMQDIAYRGPWRLDYSRVSRTEWLLGSARSRTHPETGHLQPHKMTEVFEAIMVPREAAPRNPGGRHRGPDPGPHPGRPPMPPPGAPKGPRAS